MQSEKLQAKKKQGKPMIFAINFSVILLQALLTHLALRLLLHLTFKIHLWLTSLNPISLQTSLHSSLMYFTQLTAISLG